MTKKSVLILCTGNSARSQMAEAIVNHDLGETWQAFSAGTQPAGYVHPVAIQVLSEIGIDHHGVSKSTAVFRGQDFDVVITVCDDAAENCPVWLGKGKRTHIGFPDPAEATGTTEEVLTTFRDVRDQIRQRVIPFLQNKS
jgi:arsenate reductase (thioredoxin)